MDVQPEPVQFIVRTPNPTASISAPSTTAWMQERGNDRATIGLVMLVCVLGGLAFQIPIGRLSDRLDRRIVLTGLSLGLLGTSIGLVYLPRTLPAVMPAAFLFGGFLSTLYPVSIAHAHDCMHGEQVVAVSGRLILLFGAL
jgi:MFS family permease